MVMNKKGQSALEFIMTYGWALVVLLLVISSLWFTFGGDKFFVNEKCMMGPGFLCKDFSVDEGSVTLIVKNSYGKDVSDFTLTSPLCDVGSYPTFIENGGELPFAMSGCSLNSGDVLDSVLDFEYSFMGSSITHSKSLFITAIIGSGNSQGYSGNGGSGGESFSPDGATLMLCHFDEDSNCQVGGNPIEEYNVTFSEWNGRNGVMVDEDVNLLSNPSFDNVRTWSNPTWNVTLNGVLIAADHWGTGYNGGASGSNYTETKNLYHAHINFPSESDLCLNGNCFVMRDLNCQFLKSPDGNYCHRWLGVAQFVGTIGTLGLSGGDNLTYSVSVMLDTFNKTANLFLYNSQRHTGIDGEGSNKKIELQSKNAFERISLVYQLDGYNSDGDSVSAYLYGSSYIGDAYLSEGTIVYDDVQLEYGDTLSPYAGEGPDVLKYPADETTLDFEEGTIEMWVYVNDLLTAEGKNKYIFTHSSPVSNQLYSNRFSLGYLGGNNYDAYAFIISNSAGISKSVTYSANNVDEGWHHFAVTWDKSTDGGYIEMFIDGASVVKKTGVASNFPETYENGLYVGSCLTSTMQVDTMVDELRISNIVRYT